MENSKNQEKVRKFTICGVGCCMYNQELQKNLFVKGRGLFQLSSSKGRSIPLFTLQTLRLLMKLSSFYQKKEKGKSLDIILQPQSITKAISIIELHSFQWSVSICCQEKKLSGFERYICTNHSLCCSRDKYLNGESRKEKLYGWNKI